MKQKKKQKITKSKKKAVKSVLTMQQLLKKYPFLNRKRNIKLRQDYIDIDDKFLRDLCKDEEAAKFYNQYCKEFYNADYSDEVFVKQGSELHKKLNHEHYARSFCTYNIKKVTGLLSTYNPDILNKKKSDD